MSTVKTNNVQIGQSLTAANNFTWYQPTSPDGTVRLGNGNSGAAIDLITLNSSGSLGIGTSSPATKLQVAGTGSQEFRVTTNSSGDARLGMDLSGAYYNWIECYRASGAMAFAIANTERMRIDSSGNLLVGGTSVTPFAGTTGLGVQRSTAPAIYLSQTQGTGGYTARDWVTYIATNGSYAWYDTTATAERMRIDSSGNLSIGTSGSSGKLTVQRGSNGVSASFLSGDGTYDTALQISHGTAGVTLTNSNPYSGGYNNMIFANSSVGETMRIDPSGNLLVGATSNPWGSSPSNIVAKVSAVSGGSITLSPTNNTTSNFRIYVPSYDWYFDNSGDNNYVFSKGSGSSYATVSAVINSISDRRLKENIAPLTGALSRISNLKPVVFSFKEDVKPAMPWGTALVDGFIADEFGDVIVGGTYGEKDAVKEDGSVNPQGIDMTRAIPLLVAAVQELSAKVESLEAQLKGNA